MRCQPAVCSHSLGRAWVHELPEKLDRAAQYGFDIEFFHEDLCYVARRLPGGLIPNNQLRAAEIIRSLCEQRNIKIVALQPFMHYEGLRDRAEHARRIEEMHLWTQLAHILGTDLIGIPSSFLPEEQVSGDLDLIVADLQEVADIGAAAGIRFAYEAISWGTHINTWEQSWEVVQLVDRENFGLLLDTYNIAGRVYADPTSPTGKTPNADEDLAASLRRLVETVDVHKLAFVQVVDGERLAAPLVAGHELHEECQPARMSWSRNCRLFYGEEDRGAYLPIHAILKAIIVDLGYTGAISAEVFNRCLADSDASVPASLARRAAESWQKIVDEFGLETNTSNNSVQATFEQGLRAQL